MFPKQPPKKTSTRPGLGNSAGDNIPRMDSAEMAKVRESVDKAKEQSPTPPPSQRAARVPREDEDENGGPVSVPRSDHFVVATRTPAQPFGPQQPQPKPQNFRPQPTPQQPFRPQQSAPQGSRPQPTPQQPFRPQQSAPQGSRPQPPSQQPIRPQQSAPQGSRPQPPSQQPIRPQQSAPQPFKPTQSAQSFKPMAPMTPQSFKPVGSPTANKAAKTTGAWGEESGTGQRTRKPVTIDAVGDAATRIARTTRQTSPKVIATPSTIASAPLDSRSAFVLSLVDGTSAVPAIVDASGLAEDEVIGILARLARLGLISVP